MTSRPFPPSHPHPTLPRMTTEITLAQPIQLALTPVFLLSAIGAMLNVVAGRLARVVDRARVLEADLPTHTDDATRAPVLAELRALARRMQLANTAVSLCVASALASCLLIAALFLASATSLRASQFVPVLFVIVMALLVGGLSAFLAEVRIAMRSVRIQVHAADPRV